MPMVYIMCPVTGNLVPTNHILPDTKKLELPIDRQIRIDCAYCDGIHIWTDTNGFFLGSTNKKGK
jgi:hypothetical protein